MTVYLALGSNRGDRAAHLEAGLAALAGVGVELERVSSIRQTAPAGATGRRWFLNGVSRGQTRLLPKVLWRRLRRIEQEHGRHRTGRATKKGPRTLDLDLILYGRARIRTPELTVPHARFATRSFVVTGLAELDPGLRAPRSSISARRLGAQLALAGRAARGPWPGGGESSPWQPRDRTA
ncbi:MAG: 2-amino-4-hydroxy-6-hydroxymethyldihydropteridine diphosphokinase [Terriglobales bacterium]